MNRLISHFTTTIFLFSQLALMQGQHGIADIDNAISGKNYRKALDLCTQAEVSSGTSYELDFRFGIIHASLSNFPVALQYLMRSEANGTGGLQAGLLIADCHEALGDIGAASDKYVELIRNDRSNLYIVNCFAKMLVNNRMYSDAIKWYQLLVDSVPDNAVFRKNLGGCFTQESMDEYALPHLTRAWQLNSRDLSVLTSLTNVWLRLRMPESGIETVEEAINLHRQSPVPFRCHGNLLFAIENYEGASAAYQTAYNRGDTSMLVTRQLGFSYYAANKFRESIPYLMLYYKSDTTNYEASYYLGHAMTLWTMKEEGLGYLEKALLLLAPDSVKTGTVYASIGKTNTELKNYQKGIVSYNTALIWSPGNPDYILGLAKVYDENRNLKEALNYYEIYDEHQTELIRKLAESANIGVDKFQLSVNHRHAKSRIRKIKEDLFFMGDIKKINS
jgi:tetratricopeptide (TPR) repeat protein